jgi:hypothetical protein
MITFSENTVNYPDGQQNVGSLPDAIMLSGFVPQTAIARGQPLPAQWLNWLFQRIFRLINRDKLSNNAGNALFTLADSFITLQAIDKADTNKFLYAIGYKNLITDIHTLKVVNSNILTLGAATTSGDQPVIGGTNVLILATSRQSGGI